MLSVSLAPTRFSVVHQILWEMLISADTPTLLKSFPFHVREFHAKFAEPAFTIPALYPQRFPPATRQVSLSRDLSPLSPPCQAGMSASTSTQSCTASHRGKYEVSSPNHLAKFVSSCTMHVCLQACITYYVR
jgi:hypothetical protein